jgi:hypothetical protein
VVIKDELLEEFSVITTLISPIEENIGILVLEENYEELSDNKLSSTLFLPYRSILTLLK